MIKKKIALDCDGVLLSYIECYKRLYEELFNTKIFIVNPQSYSADTHLGIDWTGRKDDQVKFYDYFAQHGWNSMQPLDGAVQATHMLKDAGYEIFVVTSIPEDKALARAYNLESHNFAFDDVIACGSHSTSNGKNIKKVHLDKINPQFFVDDLISNFDGVSKNMDCVLIDWYCENNHSWHPESEIQIHSRHEFLLDFVKDHI